MSLSKEIKFYSNSLAHTKKIARELVKEILRFPHKKTVVVGLVGDLGSGKTTFVKSFAKKLGIQSSITSPTFLIQKKYKIKKSGFSSFLHVDAYRIKKISELYIIGFEGELSNNKNIIVIEWADMIKKILPKKMMWISFTHGKNKNERYITIKK